MEGLQGIAVALGTVAQPEYLLFAFVGALIGTSVGVLPGLGPTVTMSLLLPLTYTLGDPLGALIMFAGIYYGAMYGGSTTSILLSTPGESSSIVTTFDGYRMARSGRAGAALLTAALGSFVAGTLATVAIGFFAHPIVSFALTLAPEDYFAVGVFALACVSLMGGQPLRAAFSVCVGLAIGTIGIDASTGVTRFTYGVLELFNGVSIELLAIGMFAVVEVLFVLGNYRMLRGHRNMSHVGKLYMTRQEWRRSWAPWLRGSALGFTTGSIPGVGTTIPSFMSYGLERSLSKTPQHFGRGEGMIEGVAGPESANNAASVGSMVPLLTLGIPGSAATAVMLGALQGFGVPTGPLLLENNPELVYALLASMLIGNLMLLVLNVPLIGLWVKFLKVPVGILYPMVLVVCSAGVYSVARSKVDLYLMLALAVLGLAMRYCEIPLAPAILAVVIGPKLEHYWVTALTASQGDWAVWLRSGTSVVLLSLSIAILFMPLLVKKIRTRRNQVSSHVG